VELRPDHHDRPHEGDMQRLTDDEVEELRDGLDEYLSTKD